MSPAEQRYDSARVRSLILADEFFLEPDGDRHYEVSVRMWNKIALKFIWIEILS